MGGREGGGEGEGGAKPRESLSLQGQAKTGVSISPPRACFPGMPQGHPVAQVPIGGISFHGGLGSISISTSQGKVFPCVSTEDCTTSFISAKPWQRKG